MTLLTMTLRPLPNRLAAGLKMRILPGLLCAAIAGGAPLVAQAPAQPSAAQLPGQTTAQTSVQTSAQTHVAGLRITTPTRLVDCAPVTQSPCLSAGVTPVDASGKPAPVTLPGASQLAGSITLHAGPLDLKPFYATAGSGPDAAEHTSIVLLMVDISGSMESPVAGGGTRFSAVQEAVTKYLAAMQEGSDRIAIVPFESHSVIPTIRAAVFASSRADAMAQLRALPEPGPHNNTALYQAVFSGVQAVEDEEAALERQGHARSELQPHLIVMTDGKNEVTRGDDPQLLDGPLGLQQAAAQVESSHLDVIGVGFGDRAAIDAAALQRLSTRFFYAADANELLNALHVSRTAQSHEIQFTWLLPENNRLALAGRDQGWVPSLLLEGGPAVTGPAIRYIEPAMAAPHFDRKALPAEAQALIDTHPPADAGWSAVLVGLLLFLGGLALLLILWFWVPRLIWGDSYAGGAAPVRRWSGERPSTMTASGVQVRSTANTPPGFDPQAAAAGPLQRSPAQTTQVQPRGELSRTRLTYENR